MGIPSDRAVPRGRAQAARALVPAAARAARVLQAPPAAGGHDRVADGRVREREPGLLRRSAADRLHPGRVRPQPRDRQALRSSADAADYGYCASHSPLLLGLPVARDLRPRRHPTGAAARLAEDRRTRSRPRAARPLPPPRRRDRCSATRATPAASSPPPSANATPRSSARAAKTNPATGPTSRRSANASSRSSGPAKTSSPSNATAPAPSPASANASSPASAASPPPSPSTTNSDAQAVHSSTTAPNRAESTI